MSAEQIVAAPSLRHGHYYLLASIAGGRLALAEMPGRGTHGDRYAVAGDRAADFSPVAIVQASTPGPRAGPSGPVPDDRGAAHRLESSGADNSGHAPSPSRGQATERPGRGSWHEASVRLRPAAGATQNVTRIPQNVTNRRPAAHRAVSLGRSPGYSFRPANRGVRRPRRAVDQRAAPSAQGRPPRPEPQLGCVGCGTRHPST